MINGKQMIIYLHGFNSAGSGSKVNLLKTLGMDVIAPSYPSNDIDKAIKIVSNIIEDNKDKDKEIMLVGSSMGGFMAQYLSQKYNTMLVLINPATNITQTLKLYIGNNTNYLTGEKYILTEQDIAKFTQYDIKQYRNELGALLLLDKNDNVIDHSIALNKYKGHADIKLFEGGSHRFEHMQEALPLILEYYNTISG